VNRPLQPGPTILELDRVEMGVEPASYAFTASERAAIDAYYAGKLQANPELWNGRVLILAAHRFEGRTLLGRYAESDYASLLWLIGGNPPHPRARLCFSMGALRGADGGFVLVRMAAWTANAGRIYFAAGTPDPSDLTPDGRVDLEGSMLREFEEETGLAASEVRLAPTWTALYDERRIALMRQLVAREEAEVLAARIRAFAAGEERSEIDEVFVMRGPDDFREGTTPFLRAYLAAAWEADKLGSR
jgi:8-oxo-dGTP pyrophosphatase MutT (NUDIX family)